MKVKSKIVLLILVSLVIVTEALPAWNIREKFRDFFIRKVEDRTSCLHVTADEFSVMHDGLKRSYFVHIPKEWNKKSSLPVLFLFHGGGGNARQALFSYGLQQKSDEENFLLVVPNGTGPSETVLLTWNVSFGFGQSHINKIDDLGFIKKLLEIIEKDYPVDPDRIYATGISNGGVLCHWLAAQPWNKFAAIAPVVATVGGKDAGESGFHMPPVPSTPVSVLMLNGELDDHIPLTGGRQRKSVSAAKEVISASESARFWVEANRCNSVPEISSDVSRQATTIRYGHGRSGTEVLLTILHNQGHAWPGSGYAPLKYSDQPSEVFPGNDIIWDFFKSHPRLK